MNGKLLLVLTILYPFSLCSCCIPWLGFPERMSIKDPEISSIIEAAKEIDRTKLGFDPLPETGSVLVEWARKDKPYDVMLHLNNREIAFRKISSGYKWISEQEEFVGPKEWKTVDGMEHERICITYETVHVSGGPLNTIFVQYTGKDPRLLKNPIRFYNDDLRLSDVSPIIREWDGGHSK